MALIEREALREKAIECGKLTKQDPRLLVVGLGYVLDAPAIDAAPVVHGRWEDIETTAYGLCYATCSECGYRCARDTATGKVSERFCKDCGARMDGGDGHGTD